MSDVDISVAAAKQDKLFYVTANVIIVDPVVQTCLLLKRGDNELVFPDKWAFPGGKLEHREVASLLEQAGNKPENGIENILGILAAREAKEECGLDVNPMAVSTIMNKVFIRPDNVPVLMVTLMARYNGGGVVLEADSFSDYAWVSRAELADYDVIEGLEKEIDLALNSLSS
jgi:8-oxo-dGTP pyrophosphatase MutT (NUDIX family)